MSPRYSILAAAVNTSQLSEVPAGEVLLEDDGQEVQLRPCYEVTDLRPALRELIASGFVRVYVDDATKRVFPAEEAIRVIEGEVWKGGRPFYALITTPAGDREFEREWEAAGRPERFLTERWLGWEELAGP